MVVGKGLPEEGWQINFRIKLTSETCHLDFQNAFQNRLY